MDRLKINDGNFRLEFPARGKHSAVLLYKDKKVFSCGRILCGKFSEVGALEKKLRLHPGQDDLSAEIESCNVIPFGCEYEINRVFNASSRFLRMTGDIRAVNFGRVGDITLEEIRFPADFVSVEYLVYGENAMRRVEYKDIAENPYQSSEPVVMMTVTLPDGIKVDFGCGSDVWRLRSAAAMQGVSSLFCLKIEDDELVLIRRPLIYAPETEIEQRPWRFKSIVSWSDGEERDTLAEKDCETFANSGCMLAPTARREFRRKVRRSQGSLLCTSSVPGLCAEAAHLEKPEKKELIHFDLEEYITSYVWANRQLAKREKMFAFAFKENLFSNTAAVANLSGRIKRLEFGDDPEY